jgi:hypothetical protein
MSAAIVGRASDRWRPDFLRIVAGAFLLCCVVVIARVFAGLTEFRTEGVRAVLMRRAGAQ